MSPPPIRAYLKAIAERHRRGDATEHSYRGDLETLLRALLPGVDITNEPRRITDCGAPDYVLARGGVPLGYIEAKDLDKSLGHLPKRDQAQFKRYLQSLDNFIFTNYIEFRLYRDGETTAASTATIAELRGKEIKPLSQNFADFTALIQTFGDYQGQTITTADDLAARMADKARLLAGVIEKALDEDEKNGGMDGRSSELQGQLSAFRELLDAGIKSHRFAGIYAQTIAYGMFVARLHDPTPMTFTRHEAAKLIPGSNPFLKKFFGYIADYDLDARIRWLVDDLADVFRAADVSGLMEDFGRATQRTDPFIHFYETFLGQYDRKLRKSRGVYYTPAPAVNFIVRAVDEILKKEFKLSGGLADTAKTMVTVDGAEKEVHKVQILDPGTGTGTFLADIVQFIHARFRGQRGVWPDYVREDLLPRLNGFEILMAPYAMAHVKLEMVLKETGFELGGQRLRIFLTNSLENREAETKMRDIPFANWLVQEARGADEVKRNAPVMVVIGNPPYAVSSSNKGKWIETLIKDYKEGLNETNVQPLSDDYIKFIRYGQFLVEKNGEGVLAYISNNSFIDGLIHRQMRQRLLETFDRIYILDLHGNTTKKEVSPDGSPDKNVFDIKQGVSINLFVKTGKKEKSALGEVFHFDLFGERTSKYEFLWSRDLDTANFQKLETPPPNFFFVPKDFSAQAEYDAGFPVRSLFGNFNSGIKTHRDQLVIAFTGDEIAKVKKDLQELSVEEIQEKYLFPAGSHLKVASAKKDAMQNDPEAVAILYRPFDIRRTLYTGNSSGVMEAPRHKTMRHMRTGENVGIVVGRAGQATGLPEWDIVHIANAPVEINLFRRGGNCFFPLYLYPDEKQEAIGGETARKPNLNADLVKTVADRIGMRFVPEKIDDANTFSPLDILDYIYAVLHGPTYRNKFREFLKIDFPRVPFPRDREHFRTLAKLGAELRALHLMESPKLNRLITTYPEPGDNIITRRLTKDDYELTDSTAGPGRLGRVWLNDTQYFGGVPQTAWNFPIGGYLPAQKYLKDRKNRALTWDEINHYQKIIVALVETAKVMKQIDAVA